MKKLPIGIYTLSHFVEDNYVYIDKTEHAFSLITSGKYYFLSRPRRFGKSLFLNTLKEIFEGNKALFKDLYIEDKWNFEDIYPVIPINFGSGMYRNLEELNRKTLRLLNHVEKDLGITCPKAYTATECFDELIRRAYEKYNKKVVILIDEYDQPILNNITKPDQARIIRDEMKNFYSIIKDNDAYIKFVFITGVSKFSKLNLFSGLNNLNDITLNPNYATICGYTHEDLQTTFKEYLKGVDLEEVKKWYNGYHYFGTRVYNPFDVLLFISNNYVFKNYWWSTGNTSFLIDLVYLKPYSIPDLDNYEATDAILDSFDVDSIELEVLLWQTGYLTIKEKFIKRGVVKYRLEIPNLEIQHSLNNFFIDVLTTQRSEKLRIQDDLYDALMAADLTTFEQILRTLFASIPYQNFTNNKIATYEGYYASVIYAYLASLGFETITEDSTNKGRVDLTLRLENKVYIFEFKVVQTASGNALQQIKTKKYYQKYQAVSTIFLVGIEFSKAERNIIHFEWEQL